MTRYRLILVAAAALLALALPSAASASRGDRDRDRMPDKWEKSHHLNAKKNDARKDKDRDHLRNLQEFQMGTDPDDADSDDDGVRDNREGAGTIKSFDSATGVLVIDLFASDQDLTGKVDSTTEIECEDDADENDGQHGDHEDGDQNDDHGDDVRASHDGEDGDRSGSGNSGPGNDDGDRQEGDRDEGDKDADEPQEACTADSLKQGVTVKEAELREGSDVFAEVEIVK